MRCLLVVSSLALAACDPSYPSTEPLLATASDALVGRKAEKVEVCHLKPNGTRKILSVSANAVPHLIERGDWVVTEEVCGDALDNDCDGDTDEDCCACDVVVLDALAGASTGGTFSVFGSGGDTVIGSEDPTREGQSVGPRFTLAEETVITEIGGFTNNCEQFVLGVPMCPDAGPFSVEIRPAVNGAPDPSVVLARFVLSHDDDPFLISYESVAPDLTLGPGTYFAMFTAPDGQAGALLGNTAFGYQAAFVTLGIFHDGQITVDPRRAAVRILGQVFDEACCVD